MKILHAYCSYTLGGAELQMYEICKRLHKRGVDILMCCPKGSRLYRKACKEGIPVESLNILGSADVVGILRLYNLVKQHKVTILHIHQGKLLWPAVVIKILFNKKLKVILHRRTTIPFRKHSILALKFVDCIIADSSSAKEVLMKSGVSSQRVVVVYPGIDLKRFDSNAIRSSSVKMLYNLDNCFVIGCIAPMNPPEGKGQEYLIMAFSEVLKKFPNVRLLLVGEGKIKNKLQRLVNELGLSESIIFAGYQENIEEFISAMDLVCLPSVGEESFGVVLVEAQAMSKPVIGSLVGGIKETMLCGVTGELVQPRNVEALAKVITKFVSDQNFYRQTSLNCRSWVEKNFNIEDVVDKIERIYSMV